MYKDPLINPLLAPTVAQQRTAKLIEKSKLLIHFSRHQPTLAVKALDSVAKKCQKKPLFFKNL